MANQHRTHTVAIVAACLSGVAVLGVLGVLIFSQRSGPSPAELARIEKEQHQRNAIVGGAVTAVEGWRAYRAARREKEARE